MAFTRSPSLLLLLPLFILALVIVSSHATKVAVYWGQNSDEGSLLEACECGNYAFVLLAHLTTFGGGRDPVLNLGGHCNPANGGCAGLSKEIKACQANGIKVFLSIGGGGNYNLTSADDAQDVAGYLWNNFLFSGGGGSDSPPLGDAVLDGIDFDIKAGGTHHYEVIAKSLKDWGTGTGTKVYLSASPQCAFPDAHLAKAIKTRLFDYLWVQFYNNPTCDYSCGSVRRMLNAWSLWSTMPVEKMFLGLPAAPEAAGSGYIPRRKLVSRVLPWVVRHPKFGGVMLWNRYFDVENGYSDSLVRPRTISNAEPGISMSIA